MNPLHLHWSKPRAASPAGSDGEATRPRDVRHIDVRRPLEPLPSIKLKLGFVIAAAVGATVFVFWAFLHLGAWPSVSGILAAIVAMGLVWFLSRGLTSPLREMSAAADAMAKGDYSRRVTATSREIGRAHV